MNTPKCLALITVAENSLRKQIPSELMLLLSQMNEHDCDFLKGTADSKQSLGGVSGM